MIGINVVESRTHGNTWLSNPGTQRTETIIQCPLPNRSAAKSENLVMDHAALRAIMLAILRVCEAERHERHEHARTPSEHPLLVHDRTDHVEFAIRAHTPLRTLSMVLLVWLNKLIHHKKWTNLRIRTVRTELSRQLVNGIQHYSDFFVETTIAIEQ